MILPVNSVVGAAGIPFELWELHPALNHLPIAFLLGGVALDLYGWWCNKPQLASTAAGMIVAGSATAVVAALAGFLAFWTVPAHTEQAHGLMWWHMGIQITALLLFTGLAISRMRKRAVPPRRLGLVTSVVAAGLLTVGSGIGGYIVYHGGAGIEPRLLAAEIRGEHSHGAADAAQAGDGTGHGHEESQPAADGRQHSRGSRSRATSKNAMASHKNQGRSPEGLPRVPHPDASTVQVPPGYRVEVILTDLTYPTSIEFDDSGSTYVAEGGYIYGDDVAPARVLRVSSSGESETVAENLNGPITDLLWHEGRLYISHRGKISVLESDGVRDLVTGLPSLGDHHNNQLAVGPDDMIYFGQGTATNSGVVGLDNFKMGWLAHYPDVRDVPAKDIRLHTQPFETPDPLALLADMPQGDGGSQSDGHQGHGSNSTAKHQQGENIQHHAGGEAAVEESSSNDSSKNKNHAGHDQAAGAEHQGAAGQETPPGDDSGSGASREAQSHEEHGVEGGGQEPGQQNAVSQEGTSQEGRGHHEHGTGPAMEGSINQAHVSAETFAFQPFGKTPADEGAVPGTIKASGTILRMNPDGSNLEMFAWGLRNPFGLAWGPDGKLYASDNGYDERGSRPIAHAPDCVWEIEQDAWYGFPDFAGGIPVTDSQFRPEQGQAPKFLMRDHPPVEKPLLTLENHVGAAKMDFSRSPEFGFEGQCFLALSGDMNPITGVHEERLGFEVLRIDMGSQEAETFFKAKQQALGPKGAEYVSTAGPRRPIDVRFSPDGEALYVVDVGAMMILPTATGPRPRPFPGTGTVWRITR